MVRMASAYSVMKPLCVAAPSGTRTKKSLPSSYHLTTMTNPNPNPNPVAGVQIVAAPSRNRNSRRGSFSSSSAFAASFGAQFPFPLLNRKSSPTPSPSPSSSPSVRNLRKRSGGAAGSSMLVSMALQQAASDVVTTMAADEERETERERASASASASVSDADAEKIVDVAHKLADAAGEVIRQFFRTKVDIVDKEDLSPVTIADRQAEQAMTSLIKQHFPQHGIYGEESGVHMPTGKTEYVWVLDPIDGTKSFITGKPLFGTLIALVHKGVPILGIIDQPVIRERWVGIAGKGSTLNGEPIASRSSTIALKDAYLYTTSPHLFVGSKEEAFTRVREKVKCPLYGCDCYAYGLLSAGHADLVVESGLKPYDYAALIPVIEGAGGHITDWKGKTIRFWPNSDYPSVGNGAIDVMAAGSAQLHKAALAVLDWK